MSNFASAIASSTFSAQSLSDLIENLYNGTAQWAGTTGGSSNAYTLSLTGITGSYGTGQRVRFIANHTNTGSATLNINSVGAGTIKNIDGSTNLAAGSIVSGGSYEAIYDGTNWRMTSAITLWTSWSPTYSASGSMTYTSVSNNSVKYMQIGRTVFINVDFQGTTGGTASNGILFTLPVTALTATGRGGAVVTDGATAVGGYYFLSSTTQITVRKYDASNFGLGGTRQITLEAFYEAA